MPEGKPELDPTRAATPGADASTPESGAMAPPAGSPNLTDQPAKGETEQAKANVQMAINILEQSLPQLGSDSEEGAVVLKALTLLSKSFAGKKSQDLVPAELTQLLSGQPDNIQKQIMAEM
jgi:hypothetical protein